MSYQSLMSRLSKDDRDLIETKMAAAEFYRANRVPEQIETALNQIVVNRPDDLHGYLANYFSKLSAPAKISRLTGRVVYDSRAQLSLEVDVLCNICCKEERVCSASVSSYFGPKDTSVDWKTKCQERTDHVLTALQWVSGPLSKLLQGQNPCDQAHIDHILSNFWMQRLQEDKDRRIRELEELQSASESDVAPPPAPPAHAKDKKNLEKAKKVMTEKPLPPADPPEPVLPGSLAIGAVSLAVARTGAQLQGIPLYTHIAALKDPQVPAQFEVPTCLVSLLSCGRASPGKLNLLEEVIMIPKAGQEVKQIVTLTLELQKEMMRIMNASTKSGATQAVLHDSGAMAMGFERPEQPLDFICEACSNLGLLLGSDLHLAINCAAADLMDYSKGRYEISTGVLKTPDELVDLHQSLVHRYPAVVALINPFRREDSDQWEKLSHLVGDTCSLLLDVIDDSKAQPPAAVSGHIFKHVNEMTVSDVIRVASEREGSMLIGSTNCEPCNNNNSLSDIAVGLGLDYVRLGGLSGAERMTQYSRLVCIEEELGCQGILASKQKHSSPVFTSSPRSSDADRT